MFGLDQRVEHPTIARQNEASVQPDGGHDGCLRSAETATSL